MKVDFPLFEIDSELETSAIETMDMSCISCVIYTQVPYAYSTPLLFIPAEGFRNGNMSKRLPFPRRPQESL
jgi:hypothetical protein